MIAEKYTIKGKEVANRVVFQPMEGCDCKEDGSPTVYTNDKYFSFAKGGAGIIWMEANAICSEGKTNCRQLSLTKKNLDHFKHFVDTVKETGLKENGYTPRLVIQLTHSGRQSVRPMVIYRNDIYEKTRPIEDEAIVSDEYLDALPEMYANAAKLAETAGFDGIDVKCCHGYLLMESLSAHVRKGKYGGCFENRTRLMRNVFRAVKDSVSAEIWIASRLGMYDGLPRQYGFGADDCGEVSLEEPFKLIALLSDTGLDLLNVTIGNPYYNPYINRPYRRGPECKLSPETTLNLFYNITKAVKTQFPALPIVSSGLSYYGKDIFDVGERMLADKVCDFVGFGRMTLAYPNFYVDYLQGKFDPKHTCLACSKCTELMRARHIVGCPVFNKCYRALYRSLQGEKS